MNNNNVLNNDIIIVHEEENTYEVEILMEEILFGNVHIFQSSVGQLLKDKIKNIVFDCKNIKEIDYAAVGVLINTKRILSKQKKDIYLKNVPKALYKYLQLLRISSFFTVLNT